jgi:hypothetical protein
LKPGNHLERGIDMWNLKLLYFIGSLDQLHNPRLYWVANPTGTFNHAIIVDAIDWWHAVAK